MSFSGEAVRRIMTLEREIDRLKTQEPVGIDIIPLSTRRVRLLDLGQRSVLRGDVDSFILSLPGLRGYWPMSAIDASGNAIDVSGNSRTLTYNGNPTYNVDGLAPYIDLDGTGDYLSRADEAGLDIIGTESYVASGINGLTFGGWFFASAPAATNLRGFIGKWNDNGVAQRSYLLYFSDSDQTARVGISTNGSAVVLLTGDTISTNQWYFIVGRFTPSTELAIFANSQKSTDTSSIPASIFNSSSLLNIGAYNNGLAGREFTGKSSRCFLAAAAWSDTIIDAIFQRSRQEYGV